MEGMISDDDVGHDMTGGKVGRHSKRTLASFSMVGPLDEMLSVSVG